MINRIAIFLKPSHLVKDLPHFLNKYLRLWLAKKNIFLYLWREIISERPNFANIEKFQTQLFTHSLKFFSKQHKKRHFKKYGFQHSSNVNFPHIFIFRENCSILKNEKNFILGFVVELRGFFSIVVTTEVKFSTVVKR